MRIRRSRLTGSYVQVPNGTARDYRLSHMARGILVEILSHPDGYETTADDMWRASLERHGADSPGRRAFRAAFAELKDHGYLVAERARLESGRHGTVLTAYDVPGGTGVPHAGTSADEAAAGGGVPAGGTDVPDAGTPEPSDVPDAGTSARPGDMDVSAGGTDVPPTDVPHGGTSYKEENGSSKTGKTGGDGRRPTTGSRGRAEGGFAAAPTADPAQEDISSAAIGFVIGLMPGRLREQLPDRVPGAVVDEIRTELARGLTVDQLVARVERRWVEHGYEHDAESADGPGLLRPVGVARKLVRRGNCASERCDDGWDLDTKDRCRTCEREAEDRQALRDAAQRPVQSTFLMPVPSRPAEPAPQRHTPAQRSGRTQIRDCEGPCGRVFRTVPAPAPAGMCLRCRTAAESADARQVVHA